MTTTSTDSSSNVFEMEHLTNDSDIKTEQKSKIYILYGLYCEWNLFRWFIWIIMLALSIFMCVLASFYYSFNEIYFKQQHYKNEKILVFLHIVPAFWSQLIGNFQVCGPLRRKFIKLHKLFGRIYVFCAFFASIGSFAMSINAEVGGFSTKLSLMIASALWFCSTMIGFYYIRCTKRKNENENDIKYSIGQHRMWMLRSYGLMMSPAMFRIWILLFVFVFNNGPSYGFYGEDDVKFDSWGRPLPEYTKYQSAYTAATWLCWIFNIIVVEIYLWVQANQIQKKKLHF
eukprot:24156_1